MCRRCIRARAQRSDLAKLFSVDCEKKTFLSERKCAPFFSLGRSAYSRTALRETDNAKGKRVREGHTTHTREVVCTFLSFSPSRAIYVR